MPRLIKINNKNFTSNSEKETSAIANNFAKKLKGGEIILLSGNLGAGKTTFTKSLAKALGIKKVVTSPTFVLMKVYGFKKGDIKSNLVHIDAYRLTSYQDLLDIGLEDYLVDKNSIICIEWPENIKGLNNNKKIANRINKIELKIV